LEVLTDGTKQKIMTKKNLKALKRKLRAIASARMQQGDSICTAWLQCCCTNTARLHEILAYDKQLEVVR